MMHIMLVVVVRDGQQSDVFNLGSTIISCYGKRQPTVPQSSTKAEYRAIATEARDVHMVSTTLEMSKAACYYVVKLYCNNQLVIQLAKNLAFDALMHECRM
ncbi:hypothetical protein ES288_D05G142400v1 [Gossypium darwinii]|uniref:Uncharacterized protein n=1 Tax=Gossypium darwinii TaxID=34276 RepID=A0A5D2CJI2_GOSDA|nr:hypothetical protein ES288_D05G142400v1 [Gossypium darwinii]